MDEKINEYKNNQGDSVFAIVDLKQLNVPVSKFKEDVLEKNNLVEILSNLYDVQSSNLYANNRFKVSKDEKRLLLNISIGDPYKIRERFATTQNPFAYKSSSDDDELYQNEDSEFYDKEQIDFSRLEERIGCKNNSFSLHSEEPKFKDVICPEIEDEISFMKSFLEKFYTKHNFAISHHNIAIQKNGKPYHDCEGNAINPFCAENSLLLMKNNQCYMIDINLRDYKSGEFEILGYEIN